MSGDQPLSPGPGLSSASSLDEKLAAIERAVARSDAGMAGASNDDAPSAAADPLSPPRSRAKRASHAGDGGRRRIPAKTVMLGLGRDLELWRDPAGDGYASFPNANGVREHAPIASRAFTNFLRLLSLAETGDVPSTSAIDDVGRIYAARALMAPVHDPFIRIGTGPNGSIVIDKGDDTGAYFSVTRHGFQTLSDGRPKFMRRRGMSVLVDPESGSTVRALLRPFINTATEDGFLLVVGWLLQALRPVGPYPILVVTGEQGTGKSVVTRLLRRLVDPNSIEISSPPKDLRDFLIVATNSHVLAIDNVSRIDADLSDAMCRMATGGGSRTRTLHSDSDETFFFGSRPQIVNGIGNLAERGDLADRALVVTLKTIPDTARASEADFWRDFEAAAPAIFGALLTAVSFGLRNFESTKLHRAPRLADFARWLVACESGLGDDWEEGSFLAALGTNRADARAAAFESDVVAMKIDEFVRVERPEGWCGTATELLTLINARASDDLRRRRDWPYSAQGLGNRLDRAAPLLRARGFSVERRHSGIRTISIQLTSSGDNA